MLPADTLAMSPTDFDKHTFIKVVMGLRIVWSRGRMIINEDLL